MDTRTKNEKPAKAAKPVTRFALHVEGLRRRIGKADTPQRKMLHTLNDSGKHVYQGTVNKNAVTKRRAKNKVARRSRRANRGN